MRLLVCGSRHYDDRDYLYSCLDELAAVLKISCIIEGEAPGADLMSREWAESRGVPFDPYPADWKAHGRAAGPIRNRQMLAEGKPDLVVAFPLSSSRGTRDMIEVARSAEVTTWVMPEDRHLVTALGEGVFG
jgi:hypothetical protein